MGAGASTGLTQALSNATAEELSAVAATLPSAENAKLVTALTTKGPAPAKKGKTVCICGAGNAAHVFIPYFSNQGYDVTVFGNFEDEAERLLNGIVANDGIEIVDRCDPKNVKTYKGKATVVSSRAKNVLPQADYIIAALPSFAVKSVCEGIKGNIKKGAILYIMPGQGGPDFVAKEVLKEEIADGTVTMAGIIPMPLNCRILEWGKKVDLAALKASYDLASVPAKNAGVAAAALSELLGGRTVNAIGNYVGIALHCSNPNLHPGRLYGLWGPSSQMGEYKDGVTYNENPLFYETWDDKSSDWCQKISEERCKVWKAICDKYPSAGKPEQVPMIKPYIESIYAGQIADKSTLSKCFNTNDGFKGFKCPMKETAEKSGKWIPDFKNRYFTEDIPEGFAMYKGIADLAGVETPVIDEIFKFFQGFMGKEYIKDGKLCGANVPETKSPQRFGITTLEELLKD